MKSALRPRRRHIFPAPSAGISLPATRYRGTISAPARSRGAAGAGLAQKLGPQRGSGVGSRVFHGSPCYLLGASSLEGSSWAVFCFLPWRLARAYSARLLLESPWVRELLRAWVSMRLRRCVTESITSRGSQLRSVTISSNDKAFTKFSAE